MDLSRCVDLIDSVGVTLRGGIGASEEAESAVPVDKGVFSVVSTRASSWPDSERSYSFLSESEEGGGGDFDRLPLRRSLAALELAIVVELAVAAVSSV
jgi:hypothetical protein